MLLVIPPGFSLQYEWRSSWNQLSFNSHHSKHLFLFSSSAGKHQKQTDPSAPTGTVQTAGQSCFHPQSTRNYSGDQANKFWRMKNILCVRSSMCPVLLCWSAMNKKKTCGWNKTMSTNQKYPALQAPPLKMTLLLQTKTCPSQTELRWFALPSPAVLLRVERLRGLDMFCELLLIRTFVSSFFSN